MNTIFALLCLTMTALSAMCVSGCAVGRLNVTNSNGSKWGATVVTLFQKIDMPYGNIEGVATVRDYKQAADTAAISAIAEGAVRGALKGAL